MGEPDIPIAYGMPIDPSGVPLKPSLQAATTLNGGRSSRILLPAETSSQPAILTEDTFKTLSDQGFTRGLAEALMKNKVAFPLNFWIVGKCGA